MNLLGIYDRDQSATLRSRAAAPELITRQPRPRTHDALIKLGRAYRGRNHALNSMLVILKLVSPWISGIHGGGLIHSHAGLWVGQTRAI